MSITCWEPKNIKCKSPLNTDTKCEDMLCSMIKTIEVIGLAGINYLIPNPSNFEDLIVNTEKSLKEILNACDNCVIKDCTSVICCIAQAIGVIGASGLTAIAQQPGLYDNITTYTQLLIDAMYLKVNCLNKNVNCTSVICCISQAIGVIGASGLTAISRQPEAEIQITDYTQLLIDAMYSKVNCLNKNVNCTSVICCIEQAIGVIGASGLTAIARQPGKEEILTTYTNLLIDAMYSQVNCLNKNVNCTSVICCIEQAIGVIGASGLTAISRNQVVYDKITTYTQLLIDAMYLKVNCLNKNVNCEDIQCCIAQAIAVIDFSSSITDTNEKIELYVVYLKKQININCK